MEVIIEESWKERLSDEFDKPYFKELASFVKQEYKSHQVYPPASQIFNAFHHCPFNDLKVVIVGQDPYHGLGQANGLCFSVNEGVKYPPSLQNIFKEIKSDLGVDIPDSGNLERWAKQGILMLNATLTVRANSPGSHQKRGWEEFTDAILKVVSVTKKNIVFVLWGAYAQKKGDFINTDKHLILKSPHPSPFSAYNGFFGNKHFSKSNMYLKEKGIETIKW